jgi:hypothetical protein
MLLGAGLTGLVVTGCEDTSPRGKSSGGSSHGAQTTPTRDPADVAALRTAAGNLQHLVARYDAVIRSHPPIRARLAGPRKLHTAHLTRLRSLGAVPTSGKPTAKAVPAQAVALAEIASTEQRLSIVHATAAAQRSGETARLLAMIAASQTQIAAALGRNAA